jgi:hypothetical protein
VTLGAAFDVECRAAGSSGDGDDVPKRLLAI